MKVLFGTLFMLFVSIESRAGGDHKGNGGDILVCKKESETTYRSLDMYDARHYRLPTAFSGDESAEEIRNRILIRLKDLDPMRACLYTKYVKDFNKEALFVDIQPDPIDDEGIPIVPLGCTIEQAVNQSTFPDENGIKYRFYAPLVAKLNNFHRTALYFHEFVYRDGLAHNPPGFKDSQEVRYFTAFLFSEDFFRVSRTQYSGVLGFARLPELKTCE